MSLEHVIGQQLVNLMVTATSHRFQKKIGHLCSSRNIAKVQQAREQGRMIEDARESVFVSRVLIQRKPGKVMPDPRYVANYFSALKRHADFETRDLMTLGRNNFGDFLLELPERPANTAVARQFLTWLDQQVKDFRY